MLLNTEESEGSIFIPWATLQICKTTNHKPTISVSGPWPGGRGPCSTLATETAKQYFAALKMEG